MPRETPQPNQLSQNEIRLKQIPPDYMVKLTKYLSIEDRLNMEQAFFPWWKGSAFYGWSDITTLNLTNVPWLQYNKFEPHEVYQLTKILQIVIIRSRQHLSSLLLNGEIICDWEEILQKSAQHCINLIAIDTQSVILNTEMLDSIAKMKNLQFLEINSVHPSVGDFQVDEFESHLLSLTIAKVNGEQVETILSKIANTENLLTIHLHDDPRLKAVRVINFLNRCPN